MYQHRMPLFCPINPFPAWVGLRGHVVWSAQYYFLCTRVQWKVSTIIYLYSVSCWCCSAESWLKYHFYLIVSHWQERAGGDWCPWWPSNGPAKSFWHSHTEIGGRLGERGLQRLTWRWMISTRSNIRPDHNITGLSLLEWMNGVSWQEMIWSDFLLWGCILINSNIQITIAMNLYYLF